MSTADIHRDQLRPAATKNVRGYMILKNDFSKLRICRKNYHTVSPLKT